MPVCIKYLYQDDYIILILQPVSPLLHSGRGMTATVQYFL